MNGQKKQFIVICVFLVVCIAAYFVLKSYQEKTLEKEQKQAESEKITVIQIDSSTVTSFSYQLDGTGLVFEKEEDTWYYEKDHSIPIDQDAVTAMLSMVKKVTASEELKDVKDQAEYGLGQPSNVLKFCTEDGEKTITIGMKNEITGQYYLTGSKSGSVYLTDTDLSASFGKTVEELTVQEESEEKE